MKFRYRIGLLIGLVVLELLIYSLRYRGWNATSDSGIFLQALLITSVPIVVEISSLVQSGRKFAVRT